MTPGGSNAPSLFDSVAEPGPPPPPPPHSNPASANPAHASSAAASHLPPAFPNRAAWGTSSKLRAWQQAALDKYLATNPRDFLAVATPGAGKTTFALRIATELLQRRIVQRVTVVCPTEHLKRQWADAAERVGIHLDPNYSNAQGAHGAGFDGVAVTYAQVSMKPLLHRARTEAGKTLVILDEIHHAGDSLTWGDGVSEAFDPATRRLALTGTPFRSDTSPIPFVEYEEDAQGIRRSRADHAYGYSDALRDGVVRPVMFLAYSGSMRWRTSAGDEVAARLGEPMTKDLIGQAWRTALNPQGSWIPSVLAAADKRLTEVRRGVPDAGAMIIATDQETARAYAGTLKEITGESPTIILSDEDGASDKIDEFSAGTSRWMVAVRMVSEGVDVPRLAVGVYATSTSTPLFFAQAIGRFVRVRKRGETASVFLPSVPVLLDLAAQMEVERDHALDKPKKDEAEDDYPEEDLLAQANREEKASGELEKTPFEALESQATFDRVLYDKQEFGTHAEVGSQEEEDFLGIPGLLEPDQVTTLLRQRQADQLARNRNKPEAEPVPEVSGHRQITALRKELHSLVGAWSRRTSQPHGVVHSNVRDACGGPEVAKASAEQLQERIATLRRWFVGQK
ncbi:DEAD/DEAH box helicase [Kineosporia succinea]|uniref:Superfamily II DNA or RNA helicase n=1 Tax=Kineosporia succinea TaxID=84632 RepID=A0ABT9NXZ7_9ACTN|nr:DEAD/DEAH box helicase [Kineosporia succinea]MDP9825291.1 superfamily II DNA or RNA helicase [Kineosporia succinea]